MLKKNFTATLSFKFLLVSIFFLIPFQTNAIFDMHEHFREGGKMGVYLKVAKKLGITHSVFVPTGSAPDNGGYEKHMAALLKEQRRHRKSVIAFCTVDDEDPKSAEIFENCLKKGGKGLKLLNGHPEFYDAPLDSENMVKLFKVARKYDVPVLIHASVYRLPSADKEFRNLLDQFEDVRVQFAHSCSVIYNGVHLEICEEYLEKYPNLYIDLSMGGGLPRYLKYMKDETARQQIRDFVIKYQDRAFYGTDMILMAKGNTTKAAWIEKRIRCDFDLLEKKEFTCSVAKDIPKDEVFPGLELPKEVLKKIYEENPRKFLELDK